MRKFQCPEASFLAVLCNHWVSRVRLPQTSFLLCFPLSFRTLSSIWWAGWPPSSDGAASTPRGRTWRGWKWTYCSPHRTSCPSTAACVAWRPLLRETGRGPSLSWSPSTAPWSRVTAPLWRRRPSSARGISSGWATTTSSCSRTPLTQSPVKCLPGWLGRPHTRRTPSVKRVGPPPRRPRFSPGADRSPRRAWRTLKAGILSLSTGWNMRTASSRRLSPWLIPMVMTTNWPQLSWCVYASSTLPHLSRCQTSVDSCFGLPARYRWPCG